MKKIKPYLNFLTFSLLIIFSLGSFDVQAATTADKYTVLAPLPCIESAPTTYIDSSGQTQTSEGVKCDGGNGAVQKQVDFKTYVQYMMNLLIALSAVVAVVMLVWGGIEYMFTSSFTNKKEGLERAKHAIYGLLLVLTSYIILRTVDPRLVEIPNTLVPQLKVSKWLTMDANQILMNKLEKELDEFGYRKAEIAATLKQTDEKILSKQKELDEIKSKLDSMDIASENSDGVQKYHALEVAKIKAEDEIRALNIDRQTTITKSTFTNILIDTQIDVNNKDINVPQSINKIWDRKASVNEIYKNSIKEFKKLGTYDYRPLTDEFNYTKAMMDLSIMDLIVTTAKTGGKEKVWSDNFNGKIDVNPEARYTSVVRAELKKELDLIQKTINEINPESSELKADLQQRFLITTNAFEQKFGK